MRVFGVVITVPQLMHEETMENEKKCEGKIEPDVLSCVTLMWRLDGSCCL